MSVCDIYPELHARLQNFVDCVSNNGIAQHSEGWHEARKYGFGGSQISTLMGINPYSDLQTLINEKIDKSVYKSTLSTQWGNLFEDTIAEYTAHCYKTRIIGDNIFIDYGALQSYAKLVSGEAPSTSPNLYYSPDGLGVVEKDGEAKCALFEFKCPFSRRPDGKVPKYYVPQPKTGLDMIPVVDVGVFTEAVFRRCQWTDLGNDNDIDRGLGQWAPKTPPVAYGFHVLYCTKPVHDSGKICARYGTPDEWIADEYGINDLGDSDKELFTDLITECKQGSINVYRSPIYYTSVPGTDPQNYIQTGGFQSAQDIDSTNIKNIEKCLDDFIRVCYKSSYIVYGVIPWKLFGVHNHWIDKEPGYTKQFESQINNIVEVITAVKAGDKNAYIDYINDNTGFDDCDDVDVKYTENTRVYGQLSPGAFTRYEAQSAKHESAECGFGDE